MGWERHGDKKRADQESTAYRQRQPVQVGFAKAQAGEGQWSRDQENENGAEDLRD